MLKLSLVLLLLPSALADSWFRRMQNDFCNGFYQQLAAMGAGNIHSINTGVGTGINGGQATQVGTGTAMNFGQANVNQYGQGMQWGLAPPPGGEGEGSMVNTGVGTGLNLEGAHTNAVQTGTGVNQMGAQSNLNMFPGMAPAQWQQQAGMMMPQMPPGMNGMGMMPQQPMGGMPQQMMPQQNMMPQQQPGMFNQFTQWGRRRLAGMMCEEAERPAGPDVSCHSTGDPHLKLFDGHRTDLMSFGEFKLYETDGFTPGRGLSIHVIQHAFRGHQGISSNYAVAVKGGMACMGMAKFEIYFDNGQLLRVTNANGHVDEVRGKSNIFNTLQGQNCPEIEIQNDIIHFVFETAQDGERRTSLRVQLMDWGLNLWLDVLGTTYRNSVDTGICTNKPGWNSQVPCSITEFSNFPGGSCAAMSRNDNGAGNIACDPALEAQAHQQCNKCPETVDPHGCVFDVCVKGDINFVNEIMKACRLADPLPKNINVGVGTGINMGTSIAAGAGTGINFGTSNVNVWGP